MRRVVTYVALLCLGLAAEAQDSGGNLSDPTLDQRYQDMIREVRCLVCQNQTIADSNAALAADLRREIREMIEGGASDTEVSEFLVARYGDFVLYRPRLQPNTWALWGAPVAMLLIGALVFVRILRSRLRQTIDDELVDADMLNEDEV